MHQISVIECKYELTNVSVRDISNISLVAIYYDPSSSETYLPSPMAEPISSELPDSILFNLNIAFPQL